MITSAQFTVSGSIEAVIDGVQKSVPDDMANSDRQQIAAWVAAGNTIAPYVPLQALAALPNPLIMLVNLLVQKNVITQSDANAVTGVVA